MMIIKHGLKLIGLMDKKSELLSLYKSISNEIVGSDIETIADKCAKRQVLINQIDEISDQIKLLVSKQDKDVCNALNSILAYKDNSPDESLMQVYQSSIRIKNILIEISNSELQIKTYIEDLKLQMREVMKKSMDNKKIVDYYNTVTKNVLHGTNFNTLK